MRDRALAYWNEGAFKGIIRDWPPNVRKKFGGGLDLIQRRGVPAFAKRLHGHLSPAWELFHRSGPRIVYTLEFDDVLYIADAFMKDSNEGAQMRQSDADRIERRLREARAQRRPNQRRLH